MSRPPDETGTAGDLTVFVGTYARSGGKGLHGIVWPANGAPRLEGIYPDAPDASFAVHAPRTGLHYMVEERTQGAIGVHRLRDGAWERIGQVPSGGAEPCYLALDPGQRQLAVANYGSGSVALFRLDEAGRPVGPTALQTASGHGPVADRQDRPHAHCAVFGPDGKTLYHVDLGAEAVLSSSCSNDGELSAPRLAYRCPPGSGPRHLLFHPGGRIAFLISELASTLTVLLAEGHRLVEQQRLSTLPEDFRGESLGGHLALNAAGDRLYLSNRGHDSLAVFSVDRRGSCALLQHVPSGGASPRHFALDEKTCRLMVAHEEGGTLTLFRVLAAGRLEPTGLTFAVPGAAFVLSG